MHQQDIRLMLDSSTDSSSFEFHTLATAIQTSTSQNNNIDFQNIFQFDSLKYQFINQGKNQLDNSSSFNGYLKIDRLNFKTNFESADLRLGRQAISWGIGRFWQPTDVFGAFNANELVRDYKPGIDVLDLNFYPDAFSNINLVYAFSKNTDSNLGLRYSRPVGENAYFSVITAHIENKLIVGGSLESDWQGAGIRIESSFFPSSDNNHYAMYSVAGFDYQFSSEWLLTSEIYFNTIGANQPSDFKNVITTDYFQAGLLKQLSQQLFAASLQKSITPLISINYLWLNSILSKNKMRSSSLHQLSAVYSTGNESDIRVTLISTTGIKLDNDGIPQSEFGYIPTSLSFSFRIYF